MENKLNRAEEIIVRLVVQGEPFYEDSVDGELGCACCSPMNATDLRRVEVPMDESGNQDGLSFVEHDAECPWRMAVEYVLASDALMKAAGWSKAE